MFTVHLVNFDRVLERTHETVEAALAHARETCFEAAVVDETTNEVVVTWSPISGTHWRRS